MSGLLGLVLAVAVAACAAGSPAPAAAGDSSATAASTRPSPAATSTSASVVPSAPATKTAQTPAPTDPATSQPPVPSISGVPTVTRTTGGVAVARYSLVHDGRTRVWVQYTPPQGAAGLPLVVFLSGTDSTVKYETARDRLLPLVAAGELTLVYPVAYDESWNAGDGCCNEAAELQLDDVGFVRAVAARAIALDSPDRARVYLAGYSGGGKVAWNLVCAAPGVFTAVATYGANPETPCPTDGPGLPVFIGFGAPDRAEPLAGEKTDSRGTHPPVAQNLRAWLARDGCPAASRTTKTVDVTLRTWTCAHSTTVVYALWPTQRHIWPQPPNTTVAGSAGLVMWSFLARVGAAGGGTG